MGICLGVQLLAKSAGARIERWEGAEIGWSRVSLTGEGADDLLFKDVEPEPEVFQWHEDRFGLPANAVLLAQSELCSNQGFRLKRRLYGLQFHIEVTPAMLESWGKEYSPGKNEPAGLAAAQGMINDAYKKSESHRRQANRILLNFSRIIAAREAFAVEKFLPRRA